MLVIIPTYNEKENIANIINAIFALDEIACHILIIDDASPDGTANIVKDLQEIYSNKLFLIERKGKLGLGTAYITGFKWALERNYDFITEMDADFSHNPKDLPKLFQTCKIEDIDVAIGSRYCTGVNVVNWPMSRVLISYFASKYVKFVTGLKINDTTAGFVCYKRRVLEAIDLDKIRFKGYAFQVEMKYTAHVLGYKLKEVSIIFVNRILGESKMNTGIFAEGVCGVLTMRIRKMLGKIQPLKKF